MSGRSNLVNFTAEPYSSGTPSEPLRLEDLRLQDPSITPGNTSRKRHLPQAERPQDSLSRSRVQPKYDDGTRRVYARAKKHSAYDFDSPVAAMSMLDAPKSDLPPVNTLTRQIETRQITEEQLINEVRTIYAGLVLVEK